MKKQVYLIAMLLGMQSVVCAAEPEVIPGAHPDDDRVPGSLQKNIAFRKGNPSAREEATTLTELTETQQNDPAFGSTRTASGNILESVLSSCAGTPLTGVIGRGDDVAFPPPITLGGVSPSNASTPGDFSLPPLESSK